MRIFLLPALLLSVFAANAQNIFSGEPVQVVGSFNGYATTPYGTDYRTTAYRRLSVNTGIPTDGRGQWATTINVQTAGGDVTPVNMPGGGGNGFLFISGPSANRFLNKWVFSGIGQGAIDAINNISAFNSGNDMGLNMSTAGYYTFVFNDAGYTSTNASYYVGYTSAAPVTVTRSAGVPWVNGTAKITITTSATPSTEEKIYVRYRNATNDFSSSTSFVQATGSSTTWTAFIPSQALTSITYYYVFSSTRTLAQLNANSEQERSLATLRYDDNGGANYSYVATPLPVTFTEFSAVKENGTVRLSWKAEETDNLSHYEVEQSLNASSFTAKERTERKLNTSSPYYTAIDKTPASGISFYRIAARAKDGTAKYSPVIRVNGSGKGRNFSVGSSGTGTIVMQLQGISKGDYQLSILSQSGQLVYASRFVHDGNDRSLVVYTNTNISSGLYRVVLRGNNQVFTQNILQ